MYPISFDFKDSNQPDNGFRFTCPVVKRDAMFIACMFMRAKYMRGEKFAAQDCKCAMRGGKCPAMRMSHLEWMKQERLFFDAQPRNHKIPTVILEQIEKVILFPSHAEGLSLTEDQSKNLFNGKIVLPSETVSLPVVKSEPKSRKTVSAKAPENTESGMFEGSDMTSMLNKALSSEQS